MEEKFCGRLFLMNIEDPATPGTYILIGGAQSNSLDSNNEQVDVTDKQDGRNRVLLNCGLHSKSSSISGFAVNQEGLNLLEKRANDGVIQNYEIVSDRGDKYVGMFQVSNFNRSGEHNGAEQFSCSLESSGEVAWTEPT